MQSKKIIFSLWWSVDIKFYIFTSENIKLFHQYFPVFHYFVYNNWNHYITCMRVWMGGGGGGPKNR